MEQIATEFHQSCLSWFIFLTCTMGRGSPSETCPTSPRSKGVCGACPVKQESPQSELRCRCESWGWQSREAGREHRCLWPQRPRASCQSLLPCGQLRVPLFQVLFTVFHLYFQVFSIGHRLLSLHQSSAVPQLQASNLPERMRRKRNPPTLLVGVIQPLWRTVWRFF